MLIERKSEYLLKETRLKAKMYEYDVPLEQHTIIEDNVNELLLITIGVTGSAANEILDKKNTHRIVSDESKIELKFSSQYFDSLFHSKIEVDYDDYILLLGAVSYYFCDYIGSSKVIAGSVSYVKLDIGGSGVELLLLVILNDDFNKLLELDFTESKYKVFLDKISNSYHSYYYEFLESDWDFIYDLRDLVYSSGSPRELLLVDLLLAVLLKKLNNSAMNLLPIYTGIDKSNWVSVLENYTLKELWPAQKKLGEVGILAGTSGVVQMPTSSGKTTSISLTIQSAFLSERTELAIIVTPYRALCREVSEAISKDFSGNDNIHVNELSDIPNTSDLINLLSVEDNIKDILILTPEKLLYILRQDRKIINEIGLIVFDEAHMFDDATRGTNYELLLTTIMSYLNPSTQRLLISAVIPNAVEINDWINGSNGVVISDNTIKATEKTVAFSDWEELESGDSINYGHLYFIDPENPENLEFSVPRTVGIQSLQNFARETKKRFFPQVDFKKSTVEHNDMSLYYALKLNKNGGIAIFCGTKVTVEGILKRFLEVKKRGIDISSFNDYSDEEEISKIAHLISKNYGFKNIYYNSAIDGIFAHHSGISNGIRISVEYAMKKDLIRCVVCTSTLAQGVNLPIRYLIISNLYQAQEKIKVRDFHNLVGRAGRAGKFTEGSVILSEPFVYNKRISDKKWSWNNYKEILDMSNSESCLSQILLLVRPTVFDQGSNSYIINFYNLVKMRYSDIESYEKNIETLNQHFANRDPKNLMKYSGLKYQIDHCVSAIESYILSFLTDEQNRDVSTLASETLGYYLADDNEKEKIIHLFKIIEFYLLNELSDLKEREMFSKTLLKIEYLIELNEWISENFIDICSCQNEAELLKMVIPKIVKYSDKKSIKSVIDINKVSEIACRWIEGCPYEDIVNFSSANNVLLFRQGKEAIANLNELIDICDNGFGYSSTLVFNALSELISQQKSETGNVLIMLESLCKKMRYGLPSLESINLYELGISDRYVSQLIVSEIPTTLTTSKSKLKRIIIENKGFILGLLEPFPSVFSDTIINLK